MDTKDEIKNKVWDKIRRVINKYEITCGETIYQGSRVQDNATDILFEILSPLLNELEKIDIEEVEDNDFDINKLIRDDK